MEKTRTTPFDPESWTPEMQVVDEKGVPVRVLCVDGPDLPYPVVGIWSHEKGTAVNCAHPNQLRFVVEVKTVWINYFGNGKWATEHATKQDADNAYRKLLAYESDEDEKYDFRACFETEKTWKL